MRRAAAAAGVGHMAGAFKKIKELHQQTTLGAKEGVAFRYFSRPLASFLRRAHSLLLIRCESRPTSRTPWTP